MKSKKTTGNGFGTRGYYIALILCAVAIGISGYLYYRNETKEDPQLNNPTDVVAPGDDVQVGGTLPGKDPSQDPPENTDPVTRPYPIGKPLSGETVTDHAMDCLSYNETTRDWRTHNGIDIAADSGTTVRAAAPGTVYTVYTDDTMGTTVVIRHAGGYVTQYASLGDKVSVAPGDVVQTGDAIGVVANTALVETALGDHLHFSVTFNDEPMDPMEFLSME